MERPIYKGLRFVLWREGREDPLEPGHMATSGDDVIVDLETGREADPLDVAEYLAYLEARVRPPAGERPCVRCGSQVEENAEHYETFEKMHYVCFHYEHEHSGDVDVECGAGGCPSAWINPRPERRPPSGD